MIATGGPLLSDCNGGPVFDNGTASDDEVKEIDPKDGGEPKKAGANGKGDTAAIPTPIKVIKRIENGVKNLRPHKIEETDWEMYPVCMVNNT